MDLTMSEQPFCGHGQNNSTVRCPNGTFSNQSTVANYSHSNGESSSPQVPREMYFTDDSLVSVVIYSVLFTVSATGNLTVFVTLFKYRHRKSRVNLFIMHLCIADLIVTFVMLPMEIGWHLTVSWQAGDLWCRILMFSRAFGFYLSSLILSVISLDRYFAVAHPLRLNDASRRGKIMLALAWGLSAVASTPQSVIFHEEHHPVFTWFTQCVTFNFFPSSEHEMAYNLFNVVMLYMLPLLIIIVSYSLLLYRISLKSREGKRPPAQGKRYFSSYGELRKSTMKNIERARKRALKMTTVIVCVFLLCWTPYFLISAFWWFNKDLAMKIDPKIQRALFIFAVSNSCMNPVVYGMFTTLFQREMSRHCCCKTAFCCFLVKPTSQVAKKDNKHQHIQISDKKIRANIQTSKHMVTTRKTKVDQYERYL